jgi:hypothetical protein
MGKARRVTGLPGVERHLLNAGCDGFAEIRVVQQDVRRFAAQLLMNALDASCRVAGHLGIL